MIMAVYRIIGPLASRCAKFRFKSLGAEPMKSRLDYIIEKENIVVNDKVGVLGVSPPWLRFFLEVY